MNRQIIRISAQAKKKNRFNLYDDDGFLFSLSDETLLRYRLKEGSELSEELIKTLKEEDTQKYAKELAMAYIAHMPRTRLQVEQHLAKKGIDTQSIGVAVEALLRYEYIDDEAYVLEFVRSYGARLGRRMMEQKLRQRGVAQSVIDQHLFVEEESQIAVAKVLVEKTLAKNTQLPLFKQKRKVYDTLYRKGFDQDVIHAAMSGMGEEDYEG